MASFWKVEGLRFDDVKLARAKAHLFAEERAEHFLDQGWGHLDDLNDHEKKITIMQKDDAMTPPFVLERVDVEVKFDVLKASQQSLSQSPSRSRRHSRDNGPTGM